MVWSSTWLAIRVVVRDVPPFKAAALRFVLAAGILFVWGWIRRAKWPREERQWNAIVVLSFTMMTIPFALVFWAEQYVSSSMTAILYSAVPLVVALLTPLMMHRKVPRQAVFAMVTAFGGLLILLYDGMATAGRTLAGEIAVLTAMILSAWSAVYAKNRLRDVDAVIATAWQLLIGSIGLFWATWALESHQHATWSRTALLAMSFLVIFGSAAAFAVYYWLLKHLQPYQLSTINLVVPVMAVLEGSLILREFVSLRMIIAIVVVLGSVGVVLRAEAEVGREADSVFSLQQRQNDE